MQVSGHQPHWYALRRLSECESIPPAPADFNQKIPVIIRKIPSHLDRRPVTYYNTVILKHANRYFEKIRKADTNEARAEKKEKILEKLRATNPDLGRGFGLLELKGKEIVSLTVHQSEMDRLKKSSFQLEMEVNGSRELFFVNSDVTVQAFDEMEYKNQTDKLVFALEAYATKSQALSAQPRKAGWIQRMVRKIFDKFWK